MNPNFSFSGHDSFVCKQYWLKKGIDFLNEGNKFSNDSAVVELGVGKNMVSAIRYWLRSFGLLNANERPNEMAEYLFSEKGKDPFLEAFGSIWLLHYLLVKTNKASIFSLVFNHFRKDKPEFSREQLKKFLLAESLGKIAAKTIDTDVNVFLRTYVRPREIKIEIEDDFSAMLIDLDLVRPIKFKNKESNSWFQIGGELRADLPLPIFLFSILDNEEYGASISFRDLEIGNDSPGSIFALNRDGLYNKLKELEEEFHKEIVFSESAGNLVLQFKKRPNKWEVLNAYYR